MRRQLLMLLWVKPLLAAACIAQSAPENGPSLGVRYLAPINEADVSRYAELLQLAAPQRLYMDDAFSRYQRTVVSEQDSVVPILQQRSRDAAAAYVPVIQPECPALVRSLNSGEAALTRSIQQADRVFLSEVDSVLAEGQKPLLPRLHLRRQRQACAPPPECRFQLPDLSLFLEAVGVSQDVLQKVDPILIEYEKQVTPMFEALHRKWGEARIRCMELYVEGRAATVAGDDATVNRVLAEESAISSSPIRLERELAEVNHRFARRIVETLDPKTKRRLFDEYRRVAGCVGFPDPLDPRDLAEQTIQGLLPGDTRTNVEAMYADFLQRYDIASSKLVDVNDDMTVYRAMTGANTENSPFVRELRDLRSARWNASVAFMNDLRAAIAASASSALVSGMDEFSRLERAVRLAADNDQFPAR